MSVHLCTLLVFVLLTCGFAQDVVHELVLKHQESGQNTGEPVEAAKKSDPSATSVKNNSPPKKVMDDPDTERDPSVPLEFPKTSDPSAPIVTGTLITNIPPKKFPSESSEPNPPGPPVLSITDTANITKIKNSHVWLNRTQNTTSAEKPTPAQETAEQEDMLHSKYAGGQDVDEVKPVKKASERDEKKDTQAKKDPNSDVVVTPNFDKKGPKWMNDTKRSSASMVESASGMVAVSSSMLLNSQPKHRGIIEPAKTVITVLLSAGFILAAGVIGLLVWKRITMRRFGRDVLINEDDFDEVSDMHSFDRAQIQIT